jgi:hypothetical protein
MRQGWGEAPRAKPLERGGTRKATRAFRLASPAERARDGPPPRSGDKAFAPCVTRAAEERTIRTRNWGGLTEEEDFSFVSFLGYGQGARWMRVQPSV